MDWEDFIDKLLYTTDNPTERKLRKGGSIFRQSAEAERAQLKNLGPLLGTITLMINKLGDPLEAIGGPEEAMISPRAWKKFSPEIKSMLTDLADKAPGLWEKVLKAPQQLIAQLAKPGDLPQGVIGQLTRINPEVSEMAILPAWRQIDNVAHELTHFINNPRLAKTSPEDAETIGNLLHEVLTSYAQPQGSLYGRKGQLTNLVAGPYESSHGLPASIWNRLSPEAKAEMTAATARKVRAGRESNVIYPVRVGYQKDPMGWGQFLSKSVMDEGLAHLAEAATREGAPEQITKLAEQLGVGPKGVLEQGENFGLLGMALGQALSPRGAKTAEKAKTALDIYSGAGGDTGE